MSEPILCGGFTPLRAPEAEDKAIFESVQTQIVQKTNETGDVVLEQVQTQVVNGINYKFIFKVGDKTFSAKVYVQGDQKTVQAVVERTTV
jgi:hypothetical protein